jgi:hypothetical protein
VAAATGSSTAPIEDAENVGTLPALNGRQRALLSAVAAGRCEFTTQHPTSLLVDGLSACDQLAVSQLLGAGLIVRGRSRSRSGRRLAELAPVAHRIQIPGQRRVTTEFPAQPYATQSERTS